MPIYCIAASPECLNPKLVIGPKQRVRYNILVSSGLGVGHRCSTSLTPSIYADPVTLSSLLQAIYL